MIAEGAHHAWSTELYDGVEVCHEDRLPCTDLKVAPSLQIRTLTHRNSWRRNVTVL